MFLICNPTILWHSLSPFSLVLAAWEESLSSSLCRASLPSSRTILLNFGAVCELIARTVDPLIISHLKMYSGGHGKWKEVSVTVLPRLKVCYWLLTAALVIIAENCWPQKLPYEKYVQLSFPLSLCQQKAAELWVREYRICMHAEAEITSIWCSVFKFILQKIDRGRWKRDRKINDWKGKGQEMTWR